MWRYRFFLFGKRSKTHRDTVVRDGASWSSWSPPSSGWFCKRCPYIHRNSVPKNETVENRDKIDMSPDKIDTWTNYLCQNYDPEAADAAYECYIEGEDVEVTKASRLLAISTFAKSTIAGMRLREKSTKKRILCGYTSVDQVLQHARRMGSIFLLAGTRWHEIERKIN